MSAKTATKVATYLFDKRQILRKQPTKIVENHNIADRINQLASEFAKFSAAKTIHVKNMKVKIITVGMVKVIYQIQLHHLH